MTVINTVNVVQGVPKFTAKVPRVLFTDVTVKLAVPPAATVWVIGVTFKLIGFETTIVPVFVAVTPMVAEEPLLFLTETDDGSAESVQPGPPPETGGPASPDVPAQSKVLLWTPLPATIVED